MPVRSARSFTVEFKQKRRRSQAAPASGGHGGGPIHGGPLEPLPGREGALAIHKRPSPPRDHDAARAAAHAVFRGLERRTSPPGHDAAAASGDADRPPPTEMPEERAEISGAAASNETRTGRILPDLRAPSPVPDPLQREAEPSPGDQRRGGGAKPPDARDASAGEGAGEGAAASIPPEPTARHERTMERAAERRTQTAEVGTEQSSVTRTSRRSGAALYNDWAYQAARREAHRTLAPVSIRAGERWKRRLPKACW